MDVAIIREKYRFKICCQRAKDWKNFSDRSSCSFLSMEKIYIAVNDFSSPSKIFPREKISVAGKIKKKYVCHRERCYI